MPPLALLSGLSAMCPKRKVEIDAEERHRSGSGPPAANPDSRAWPLLAGQPPRKLSCAKPTSAYFDVRQRQAKPYTSKHLGISMADLSFGTTVAVEPACAASVDSVDAVQSALSAVTNDANCLWISYENSWLRHWASLLPRAYDAPRVSHLCEDFSVIRPDQVLPLASEIEAVIEKFQREPFALLSLLADPGDYTVEYVDDYRKEIAQVISRQPELPHVEVYLDGRECAGTLASFLVAHLAVLRRAQAQGFAALHAWFGN
ncbi:hypothetical protein [Roseateles sp. P5_D6]